MNDEQSTQLEIDHNGIYYLIEKSDQIEGYAGTAEVIGLKGNMSVVNIPEGINTKKHGEFCVTSIGAAAFQIGKNVINMETVLIPRTVTKIKSQAFGCFNLRHVVISDQVENMRIGNQAFEMCSNLESILIPDGVISIEDNAFPRGITLIGKSAYLHYFAEANRTIYNFKFSETEKNAKNMLSY